MSDATLSPKAPEPNPDAAHAEDHGSLYPDSGIVEGHARVPPWLAIVIVSLLGFFVWYIATQWSAQTSSAQPKR